MKKDYTCVSSLSKSIEVQDADLFQRPDCPDPARCQTQLDEKWRQAHSAVCRYGPPQPSVAFR